MSSFKVYHDHPLSQVSTFGIGGPAKYFIIVKNEEQLLEACNFARSLKLKPFIYGNGSNLLFPDAGLNTVVIKNSISYINQTSPTNLNVGSGTSWAQLSHFCSQHQLYGLEALFGLPGTLGGAIFGNAGCHNQETFQVLSSIKTLNLQTLKIQHFKPDHFKPSYRHTNFMLDLSQIIVSADLTVSTSPQNQFGEPKNFAQYRQATQPKGLSTGSFFKNPPNHHAGALIEQAGLKGYAINGIKTSELHANFFINFNNATAQDVLDLKTLIQDQVFQKFNIKLEPEIKIIESQDWHL